MSGVYPYCIVPSGHDPPPGLTGFSGGPVEGHDEGDFAVWLSREAERPRADLDTIRRHHEVVRAAVATVTPLPVRFGAWAPDTGVLSRRLARARTEIGASLLAVAGRVELGVYVAGTDPRPAALTRPREVSDGRSYLRQLAVVYEARRSEKERRDALVESLRSYLEGLALDERVRTPDAPGLVAVAHLVERGRAEDAYAAAAAAFARAWRDECSVRVTGPWPPYSFTAS